MDCVGSHAGNGLTYDESTHGLYVNVSSDTANMTQYGSDDGIYTPPTVVTAGTATTITGSGTPENPYVINTAPEVGDTAIQAGDGVTITGTGVTADPYVVSTVQSYATLILPSAQPVLIASWQPVALDLEINTGDVVDSGDGITYQFTRYGVWQLTAYLRFSAAGTGRVYGTLSTHAPQLSSAWGGIYVGAGGSYGLTLTQTIAFTAQNNTFSTSVQCNSSTITDCILTSCRLAANYLGPAIGPATAESARTRSAPEGFADGPVDMWAR